jgi:hypothetical protein
VDPLNVLLDRGLRDVGGGGDLVRRKVLEFSVNDTVAFRPSHAINPEGVSERSDLDDVQYLMFSALNSNSEKL